MGSQQFCLKWNNHQLNMLTVFDQLLQNEAFVDVTIACEGLSLKAHKMVLSACSPYFQNLFMDNPCKHPIVILKDIRYDEMKAIIDFMYKGEVNVSQDQLSALLKTAEALKVKGLAEVTGQGPHGQVQQSNSQSSVLFETVGSRHSPPAKRKKRPPASAPVSIGSPVSPGNSNTSHSTSSHRALSPPHPVVQSAVSLAPVASVGSSATTSGMCSGDEEQTPLMGLNRSRNIEGVPGSSKDSLSNVKEEKIEMEEPPDEVEDLIMEATPEHIEIEPSTTDTGFNGSTQDQSQLANIKYGNMFNPQPSTSGTSPGHELVRQTDPASKEVEPDVVPEVTQDPSLDPHQRGGRMAQRNAIKTTRIVELGWLMFDEAQNRYRQVKNARGGGTRRMTVPKSCTMKDLITTGRNLFFPGGCSAVFGPADAYVFMLTDSRNEPVGDFVSVQTYLNDRKYVNKVHFYIATKHKALGGPLATDRAYSGAVH